MNGKAGKRMTLSEMIESLHKVQSRLETEEKLPPYEEAKKLLLESAEPLQHVNIPDLMIDYKKPKGMKKKW